MINQETLITFSYLLPASISVLYILTMGARFYDLRSNLQAEPLPYNYSIILRISLLTLDITAEFIEILLVIFYSDTKKDYISGVLFVNMSAIIIQIFLMCYEYKKRVPLFFAHKIYWIFNWLLLLISLALLIDYKGHVYEYTLSFFRLIVYTLLLVFTLFIRKQDLREFENVGFWRNEFPEIDLQDSQKRPRLSTLNANSGSLFLQIDVKKRWNIVNDDVQIKFEIQIIGLDKQFKLKKSVSEIFQWHQYYIIENADYFEQNPNELLSLNFYVKQIQDSQDLQLINSIQRYFNAIISKLDLITNSFMDFIELSQQEQALIEEIKQKNNIQNYNKSSNFIKKAHIVKKVKWDVQSDYLPYMQVHISEHKTIKNINETFIQYTILVYFENEQFCVQKRFKEFFEFSEQMKSLLETKNFPPFPLRTIIKLTNEEIEERKLDLEIFMKILLNDRQYHIPQLFRFIGMQQSKEDQVINMQQQIIRESEQITNLQIKNLGFEEFYGQNGEKFLRYSFQISLGPQKYIIWKRFSQFDELHNLLKQRYQQLPQLPYKTTASLQQISPNLRSLNLQQYLQDLIKVPTIGENIHVRQFLEMRNYQENFQTQSFEESLPQLENILQKLDNNNKDIDQLDKADYGNDNLYNNKNISQILRFNRIPKYFLSLHEYQTAEIFKSFQLPIPPGKVCKSADEAYKAAARIIQEGTEKNSFTDVVVKAQVYTGGRGKGYFKRMDLIGIHIASTPEDVREYAQKKLGNTLITKQTGSMGKKCEMVYVVEPIFSILLDRNTGGLSIVASEKGGIHIEESDPNYIKKFFIDMPNTVEDNNQSIYENVSKLYKLNPIQQKQMTQILQNFFDIFLQTDATLLEINPLGIDLQDVRQKDWKEVEASKHGLNYIALDGNIGCMVNGAGLAMATMDLIKQYEGTPVNFLDVGGRATDQEIVSALKIMEKDSNVEAILINIFAGISRCDQIVLGLLKGLSDLGMKKPMILRMKGTKVDEAKKLIEESGFNMMFTEDLDEAAKKAVRMAATLRLAKEANINVNLTS